MSIPLEVRHAVEDVVAALVRRDYDQLTRDGRAGRLTAEELQRGVADYGRTLIELPMEAWDVAEAIPLDADPLTLALDVFLWTREEGRSDLELRMTIDTRTPVTVRIDDLLVS